MYKIGIRLKPFVVLLILFAGVTFSSTDSTFWKKMDVGEGEFIFITGDELDNIYVVRFANNSGWNILLSADKGETWTTIVIPELSGIPSVWIESLLYNVGNNVLLVATTKGLYVSNNQGSTWTFKNNPLIQSQDVCSLFELNDSTIIAGYADGFYKTTDFGNTWIKHSQNGITSNMQWFYSIVRNSNNDLFSFYYAGKVIKSNDNGVSWTQLQTMGYTPLTIAVNEIDYLYIGYKSAGIYRSTDNGNSWQYLTYHSRSIGSICFYDGGIVVAGTSANHAIISTDYGDTWAELPTDNWTTTYINSTYIDKSGYIYAGSYLLDGVLYRSRNPLGTPAGIDEKSIPEEFVLYNNYPNPFNPETNIRYYLPEETDVKLELYNALGEKVSTLTESPRIRGEHSIVISSKALNLSSGTYFCRLTANGKVKTIKMVLLK